MIFTISWLGEDRKVRRKLRVAIAARMFLDRVCVAQNPPWPRYSRRLTGIDVLTFSDLLDLYIDTKRIRENIWTEFRGSWQIRAYGYSAEAKRWTPKGLSDFLPTRPCTNLATLSRA